MTQNIKTLRPCKKETVMLDLEKETSWFANLINELCHYRFEFFVNHTGDNIFVFSNLQYIHIYKFKL